MAKEDETVALLRDILHSMQRQEERLKSIEETTKWFEKKLKAQQANIAAMRDRATFRP